MIKKVNSILAFILISFAALAQVPQLMSYQAVIRNATNDLATLTTVGMQISILQGSSTGTAVYVETQHPTTNANGLVSLSIGSGSVISGSFSQINWAAGPYFIKTETDLSGGSNYSITGVSQLMSVPFALYAANSTPGPAGNSLLNGPSNPTPATGNNGDFYINTNTDTIFGPKTSGSWTSLTSLVGPKGPSGGYPVHYIGEQYGGGIVFYVYEGGQHGLIAATADLSDPNGITWDNPNVGSDVFTNAQMDGLLAGKINTYLILAAQRTVVYGTADNSAAYKSVSYNGGNFSDWYLPSKFELNLLYLQKAVIGGFDTKIGYPYLSSTEFDTNNVWTQEFVAGTQSTSSFICPNGTKSCGGYARAIRAF